MVLEVVGWIYIQGQTGPAFILMYLACRRVKTSRSKVNQVLHLF
jgi:hypothetical protein